MAYITKQDLIDRFGQDELPELSGGGDDDVKINAAIADADNFIDSILRSGGIDVPLRGNSAQGIKRHAARIVRYFVNEDANTISEEIEKRYGESVEWLGRLQSGELSLDKGKTPAMIKSISVRRT